MGYLETWELNSCLLSTKAGPYSVSRLNVVLGMVLLVTWTIVFVAHFLLIFNSNSLECDWIKQIYDWIKGWGVGWHILCALLSIIIVAGVCNLWGKSNAFDTPQGDKAKKAKAS